MGGGGNLGVKNFGKVNRLFVSMLLFRLSRSWGRGTLMFWVFGVWEVLGRFGFRVRRLVAMFFLKS